MWVEYGGVLSTGVCLLCPPTQLISISVPGFVRSFLHYSLQDQNDSLTLVHNLTPAGRGGDAAAKTMVE